MPLGLGSNLSKTGLTTPGIVTDNLVLKHKYDAGSVIPVSDGAAYFDGDNDKIVVSHSTDFNFGTGNFTFACWVLIVGDGNNEKIFDKNDGSNGWHIYLSAGKLRPVVAGTGAVTRNTELDDNKWHHIAVTANRSGNLDCYVDGVLEPTTSDISGDSTTVNNSADAYIGTNESNGEDFSGYLCNIGIWSAVLTQPQIKSIMNKNYAGLTDSEKTNLVSWWNLDSSVTTVGRTFTEDSHGSNTGELL
jgi:hypothetical protein